MSVAPKPDSYLTKKLSSFEKNLGVDLKITVDGDLQLNNLSDLDLIVGVNNAAQALFLKMNIEPGGLIYHPQIGAGLLVGDKTRKAFDIKSQLVRSITSDSRFENVQVSVNIEGSTYIIDLVVTLAGTGIAVPLQFAVER
jgi:hypothetical protein